jgi:hypothetical protein
MSPVKLRAQLDQDPLEVRKFKFSRTKYWIDWLKWVIATGGLVWMTFIVDNGFKERSAGIQEMQAFDKYVDIILRTNNIEDRWKLAEFFSTVTPTDRLRKKWISYKMILEPDYVNWKKLQDSYPALLQSLTKNSSPEAINKVNLVRRQLESYNKGISSIPQNDPKNIPVTPTTTNTYVPESNLRRFKDQQRQDSATDTRYKVEENFNKVNELYNSIVRELLSELGEPYTNIQTGIDFNYKDATFSNQYGIVSKFDNAKKIWPIFQAKFTPNEVIVSMKENDSTETFKTATVNIQWSAIKDFARTYFLKRLTQLR